jgi:hypothetical protein
MRWLRAALIVLAGLCAAHGAEASCTGAWPQTCQRVTTVNPQDLIQGAQNGLTVAFTVQQIADAIAGGSFDAATLQGGTWGSPGVIGGSVPNQGLFTLLSASGVVSGAGFINYFATPPPLGITTPNTIKATTITAQSLTLSAAQSQNSFYGAPAGSGGAPSFRLLVGADLPLPTLSSLGGIEAIAPVTHQFVAYIDTAGNAHLTQPTAADVSGLGALATLSVGAGLTSSLGNLAANVVSVFGRMGAVTLTSGDVTGALGYTPQGSALANADILIGNNFGIATPVAVTGDASLNNAGALTVSNLSHVTNGSLANAGLANAGLTLGSTALTLGATTTTIAGLTLSVPTMSGGTIDNAVLGGSVPAAANVTTLTASGAVTGTGITALFSSPLPIGNVAPGTGAFTTLSANGAASFTGSGTGLTVTNGATFNGVATFNATGSNGSILGGSGQALIISPGSTNQNIQFGAGSFGVGSIATMTFSSAGLPVNGTTGHVLTVNNLLNAQFYRSPGSTYTLSSTTIPYPALFSASFTGTYSGGQDAFMKFTVPTDNVNSTVQAIADTAVYANFGGSAFAGARIGNLSQMNQNGNMASGASINAQASWLFAGCAGCTNPLAKYYAGGVQTVVAANTTAYGAFGAEDNIKVLGGSVLSYKAIRTFINETGDAVQGGLYDTFIGISSQNNVAASSTVGGLNLVAFGRPDGQYPGDSGGTQIGEYRQTANASDNTVPFKPMASACGYCQPDVHFTGNFLQSAGFNVAGTGALSSGALTIALLSNGATIDVTRNQLTASSVAAGGNNYIQGEDVYDANGNSWNLTNVIGGVVQAGGIALKNVGYGATTSGTYAASNGHGSGLTIAETWSAPTTLNLGTGVATAINIGNSSAVISIANKTFAPAFESANTTNLIVSPGGNGTHITFGDPSYGIGSIAVMNFSNAGSTFVVTGGSSQIQTNSLYAGVGGTLTFSGTQAGIGTQYGFLESLNLAGSVSSGTIAANKIVINQDISAIPNASQGATWFLIGGAYGGAPWQQSTAYVTGNNRAANGNYYTETAASCTSSSSGTGPTGTGTGIADGTCTWNYVSLNGSGSRSAQNVSLNIQSFIGSTSDTGRQWQAQVLTTAISANQGGTAPNGGSSAGFVYAGGDQMWCFAGATNLSGCAGREIDVGIYTGASAATRYGLHVVGYGNLQGNEIDQAISVTGGTAPFNLVYAVGGGNTFAATAGGTLFGYNPGAPDQFSGFGSYVNPQTGRGIDLSGVEFTDSAFRLTGGFKVSNLGQLLVQSMKISTSGSTATIDVGGGEVNAATVPSGVTGTNYRSTDHLYDPSTGTILSISVNGSNQIVGYTIVTPGHYASAAPTNPVTLLGGTGTGAQVNFAYAIANAIGVGTTSATATNIGNASAVTNFAGESTWAHIAAGPTIARTGNGAVLSNANPTAWLSETGFVTGSITSGTAFAWNARISDSFTSTSTNAPQLFNLEDDIAPNGSVAVGNRIGLNAFVNILGNAQTRGTFTGVIASGLLTVSAYSGSPLLIGQTITYSGAPVPLTIVSFGTGTGGNGTYNLSQSISASSQSMTAVGTHTNPGIDQAINTAIWIQSNEGGSATVYQGAHTTYGSYCEELAGTSFVHGCANYENDLLAVSGVTYMRNTQGLYVHIGGSTPNAALGALGPDLGLVWGEQSGVVVTGYKCIMCLGQEYGGFPNNAFGAIIQSQGGPGSSLGSAVDVASTTFSNCDYRAPHIVACTIQATGITGNTRLTSNGQAASSYIYNVYRPLGGTGYTSLPTITVTGCTGAIVNGDLGAGGTLGNIGVNNPGTGCVAEATAAVSGGGGSGATVTLQIAGNTLNFPPHSTVNVVCTVAATSLNHGGSDAIGWHVAFGAQMGATASTTQIIGLPTSWTQDYATSSAGGRISIAAPAADTTLGAIDLEITPTVNTWDIGGRCTMTRSSQI